MRAQIVALARQIVAMKAAKIASVDGRDVGDPNVLEDVGAAARLHRARVEALFAADEGAAEVKQELQRAAALGVSGVPTVLVNGTPLFSGAIRTELMETALRRAATHDRG
jgi:predicted DsbA family dithiol-disulfide isomerase